MRFATLLVKVQLITGFDMLFTTRLVTTTLAVMTNDMVYAVMADEVTPEQAALIIEMARESTAQTLELSYPSM